MKNINLTALFYSFLFIEYFSTNNDSILSDKNINNSCDIQVNNLRGICSRDSIDLKKVTEPEESIIAISIPNGGYITDINQKAIGFFESIFESINSDNQNGLIIDKNASKEEYEEECRKFKEALYYFIQNMKKLKRYVLCVNFENTSFCLRKKDEMRLYLKDIMYEKDIGKSFENNDKSKMNSLTE